MSEYPKEFRWDLAAKAIDEGLTIEAKFLFLADPSWVKICDSSYLYKNAVYRLYVEPPQQYGIEL